MPWCTDSGTLNPMSVAAATGGVDLERRPVVAGGRLGRRRADVLAPPHDEIVRMVGSYEAANALCARADGLR